MWTSAQQLRVSSGQKCPCQENHIANFRGEKVFQQKIIHVFSFARPTVFKFLQTLDLKFSI
ncbi:hypothetical protein TTHERM_00621080 (macronuclear) [Tetrahymena thermophila SB210]|uniref:Uncharacterized protein n=1 Tax=Tetrahymena thermophila (strain SB210) TaxID=312017 RepID=Q23MF1_TETTS|nr:hypothetical protein TTHERM_00621080 [Tetrahymena thermophila SB210]EAR97688.1 hypothetical protein TTHERM_00621080 [Tetrahymena thermophila SB210]|eukprot:XP_001017933.1 hypothetical protein TTHERM_00621080 [Tetrahymena thermophila SB210]